MSQERHDGTIEIISHNHPILIEDKKTHGDLIVHYSAEVTESAEPNYPIHLLPPAINHEFGDYGQLNALRECTLRTKSTVVAGMMGSGKTISVLTHVQQEKDKYDVICFIDASSKDTIEESYLSLAKALSITGMTQVDIIQGLKIQLGQLKGLYLLIFDNVINPDDIKPYLPKFGNEHIIITTQLTDVTRWNEKVIELKKPNHNESVQLLRQFIKRTLTDEDNDLLHPLADILQNSPFTIYLTAKFIENHNINIETCIALLKGDLWELFKNNDMNTVKILSAQNDILKGLSEPQSKLLQSIKSCPEGKLQKEFGLTMLKTISSLVGRGLLIKSPNNLLTCHPLIAMILNHTKEIEALSAKHKTPETKSTEHFVPSLGGPLSASMPSETSFKFQNKGGQSFFEVQSKFTFPNGGDFTLSDNKIELHNVTAPNRTIHYSSFIQISEPKYPIFSHLHLKNLTFTDWDDYIRKMQDALLSGSGVVLTGMAGVGKSEIADYFSYQITGYDLIFTLNAHNKEKLVQSYYSLGHAINIFAGNETEDDYIQRIRTHLDCLGKKCLLVFDGAPNNELLAQFLPNSPLNRTIITSRFTNGWAYPQLEIALPTMHQAKQFFNEMIKKHSNGKRSLKSDESDLDLLINILGFIPAYIEQAAQHICHRYQGIADYLKYFTTGRELLWEFETKLAHYPTKVQQAWDEDYASLPGTAKAVLHYFASQELCTISKVDLEEQFGNNSELYQACDSLCSRNMLTKGETTYHINPVLHLVIRQKTQGDYKYAPHIVTYNM